MLLATFLHLALLLLMDEQEEKIISLPRACWSGSTHTSETQNVSDQNPKVVEFISFKPEMSHSFYDLRIGICVPGLRICLKNGKSSCETILHFMRVSVLFTPSLFYKELQQLEEDSV